MYWPNLKSVALSVPETIGGTQNIWTVPGYAHAPFSPKFLMGFCSDGPCYCSAGPNSKFVALPVPEENENHEEEEAAGIGSGTVGKSIVDFLMFL